MQSLKNTMTSLESMSKTYEKNSPSWATKITNIIRNVNQISERAEKAIDEILTSDMKGIFQWCFQQYLIVNNLQALNPVLGQVWINEMKSNEYNPIHFHTSSKSVLGLSSVLMLKRPDWYGIEASREDAPANGWLEFTGGDQSPLSLSQKRVDAQVGEFYVFPYTLLHGVYPFNTTDQVRRTLSYNCDLIEK